MFPVSQKTSHRGQNISHECALTRVRACVFVGVCFLRVCTVNLVAASVVFVSTFSAVVSVAVAAAAAQQQLQQQITPPLPVGQDPFVLKATAAVEAGTKALRRAGEVHAAVIEGQIVAVSSSSRSGHLDKDRLHDYPHKQEMEMERRVCAREVEAVGHELDSLLEEVEVQHHLGAAEQQRMRALILSQLQSVDHERQLLSAPGPLDDLPDALIDTLVEVSHGI